VKAKGEAREERAAHARAPKVLAHLSTCTRSGLYKCRAKSHLPHPSLRKCGTSLRLSERRARPRQCVRVSGGDRVSVRPFEPPPAGLQAALVTAELAPLAAKRAAAAAAPLELDAPALAAHLLARFQGQVRRVPMHYRGVSYGDWMAYFWGTRAARLLGRVQGQERRVVVAS